MGTELSAGQVVAGYRIEAAVGRGAAADVYRAREEESGGLVALKLLGVSANDERFRQRFLRESELAASLEHPNVVRTLASGEADGRLYLAMEYIDGSDLRRMLREEGRFDPERAVEIGDQVAGALDAAHAAGLIHRDVKPGNILVRTNADGDHAYICDFGLARHVSSASSLTGDRGFVGTIDYVPPEQIEGGTIDGRADVYSLGCVLYECLTGARPFERDSELSTVFAHLNEPPPKATDVRPELPAAFDDVFATALAKSPDDRYSSCGELAAAARAALRGEVMAPRRPRQKRLIAIAVAAAAIAAAAVAGLVLSRGGNDESLPVTITPTTMGGARLGDSTGFLQQLWGDGYQKLAMQTPPDYSVLTHRSREVSAYFVGTDDKAVELTTWNSAARTPEGIGPCSTLEELKKAYGSRLKPSPNNHTPAGVPLGYTVGKHLFFALGPGLTPKVVEAVALYSNPLSHASYNAMNEGPCAAGAQSLAASRPAATAPATAPPELSKTLAAKAFEPRVSLRAPSGWSVRADDGNAFAVATSNGTQIAFRRDPAASTATGSPLNRISGSPNGLVRWLQQQHAVVVTTPNTTLLGRPALTVSVVDVRPRSAAAPYLAFRGHGTGSPLRASPGRPVRLYLTAVRLGTVVHTLAFTIESPSKTAFEAALPAAQAMLASLKVSAAPVLPLSSLSSFCQQVFMGSCVGELTPGTHSSTTFRPALTYTVPLGWTNYTDHPGVFGLVPPGSDWEAVDNDRADYILAETHIATSREGCADGPSKIRTPAAFARWLAHEPGLQTTKPAPVTVGGLSGVVVDIRMRKDWNKACGWSHGVPAAQVLWGLAPSPKGLAHGMYPQPMVMRLYLLAYRGGTLGIEIDEVKGSTNLPAYSSIVSSFRFKQ